MKLERDSLIDGDWLIEHINTHPGLKQYELKVLTQTWGDEYRGEVIDWIVDGLDAIEIREHKPKRGPPCQTYWPKSRGDQRPGAGVDRVAEALKEITEAKSRIASAERSLLALQNETAERRRSELQAAKAAELPAAAA